MLEYAYSYKREDSCVFSAQYYVDAGGKLWVAGKMIPSTSLVKGVVRYRDHVFILFGNGDLWRSDGGLITGIPKVIAINYNYDRVMFITVDGRLRSYKDGKYRVEKDYADVSLFPFYL